MKTFLLAGLTLLLLAPAVRAYLIMDDEPPVTYRGLITSPLVVLAHYDSHKDNTLTLKIDRILHAPDSSALKTGDLVTVTLAHWWSVETGPVGFNAMMQDAKGDGQPRICYKDQFMNPGPLVPEPILEKDQPGIFFFPEDTPMLQSRNQIQPAIQVDGWQQAISQKPIDLSFRLAQHANMKIHDDAVAEFRASRDKKIITQLLEAVAAGTPTSPKALFDADQAMQLLLAIGDKEGDVYDAALAKIPAILKQDPPWPAFRLGDIMAHSAPDRALKQFEGSRTRPRPFIRAWPRRPWAGSAMSRRSTAPSI